MEPDERFLLTRNRLQGLNLNRFLGKAFRYLEFITMLNNRLFRSNLNKLWSRSFCKVI